MGRKKKDSGDGKQTCTYFKVLATFQCSKDNCNRVWHSAHAWEREDGGIICEVCETEADLVNVVDEMLKLDTYQCPKQSCEKFWQSIHNGKQASQKCDCGTTVSPEPSPQERFSRHYTFKCNNKSCEKRPEWEDFSIEQQKTQRCTKCNSRGVIKRIQKLRPRPWWITKQLLEQRKGTDGGADPNSEASSNKIVGLGLGKCPSTHNSTYCDMCQDIIRQGKGRSCHRYRKVKSAVSKDANSGSNEEKILHVE